MKRIMIVGAPGSGKSTLARQLGNVTGLPVFHMDHIHWKSGWEEREISEKIKRAHEVEAKGEWIFEGGLSSTYNNRASRADLIIWLDLHILLRLWRVFARTLRSYGQNRPDLPEGCPEQFSFEFYHYILTSNRRDRKRMFKLLETFSDTLQVRLVSPRDVDNWLKDVQSLGLTGGGSIS